MLAYVDNILEGFADFNASMSAKIITKERKKEIKNNIVKWMCEMLEKLPLSMNSIGVLIRSFHMASPVCFFLLLLLCRSKVVCLIVLFILVVIAFSFFFFDTCMISSLENKLIGDDFNIIYPVLELFGLETSFANRLKISYAMGCFYIVGMFGLYFLRFHLL